MPHIPDELLLLILSNIREIKDPDDAQEERIRRHTFLSLSLASKTLNRLAHPILYHSINFRLRGFASLRPLLVTLAHRPDICKLVAHLHLPRWETELDTPSDDSLTKLPTPETRSCFCAATDTLDITLRTREMIQHGFAENVQDAELALLIGLCTGLKLLDLQVDFQVDQNMPDTWVTHVLADQRHLYEHLTEVRVQHAEVDRGAALNSLSTFLNLPAVQIFRGSRIECCHPRFSQPLLRSTVREIYLTSTRIRPGTLDQFFHAYPDLQTFSSQWRSQVRSFDWVDYVGIGKVLRHRGKSLRKLELETDARSCMLIGQLGSLQGLEALRELEVPFSALVSDPSTDPSTDSSPDYLQGILPRSLETLVLLRADGFVNHDIQLLQVMEDESYRVLRSIRLQRSKAFSQNLKKSAWDDSGSDESWVVLRRGSRH